MESKYLIFEEKLTNLKTKVFFVFSKSKHEYLGQIKWHPGWRQHCFFTARKYTTIWSKSCLEDLALFIEEMKPKEKEESKGKADPDLIDETPYM